MTRSNYERALRAFCLVRPFRPFIVELVSGEQFEVRHPEAQGFRGPLALFVSPQQFYRCFDHQSVCQLFHTGVDSQ